MTRRNAKMPRTKIDELLRERHGRRSPLQRLLNQAADHAAWTAELRTILPENLRCACQARGIRGNVLVVACTDSASATRLRLLAPELTEKLRALPHFSRIAGIRAKVSPH